MSHLVSLKTEVRDAAAVAAACRRLGLAEPFHGEASLYGGEVTGLVVQLPDWSYPLVIDTSSGVLNFDNFGGAWGAQAELDRFLQAYAAEKVKIEARRRGHSVTETPLADGSLKLTIQTNS